MSGDELILESGMRSVLMAKFAGDSERSFFEVAGDLIGAGEGLGDLSINCDCLKGYGE